MLTLSVEHDLVLMSFQPTRFRLPSATLGCFDLLGGTRTENYGPARPGCWVNAIPAGGLVLMPGATDRCRCSYLIKASIAVQPMPHASQ